MATYNEYLPGPDITNEIEDPDVLWGMVTAQLATWAIAGGGGSPSGDYSLRSVGTTGAPQPSLNFTYSNDVDTVNVRVRYWYGLTGTLDPASWVAATHSFPAGVLGTNSYAALVGWFAVPGGDKFVTCFNPFVGWIASLTAVQAMGATRDNLTYTEGARSGGIFGVRYRFTYNPTSSELAAGILQLVCDRIGTVSDVDDGTLTIVSGGNEIGTALRSIPQVILDTQESAAAWGDVAVNLGTIADSIVNVGTQVLGDINVVTNAADLGSPTRPSKEPATPKVEIFHSPAVLPVVVNTPGIWSALTTLPSIVTGALAALGYFLATASSLSILSTVSTAVQAVGNLASSVTSGNLATRLVEAVEAIAARLKSDDEGPCSGKSTADVLCSIEQRLASIEANQETVVLRTRGTTVHLGPLAIEE